MSDYPDRSPIGPAIRWAILLIWRGCLWAMMRTRAMSGPR